MLANDFHNSTFLGAFNESFCFQHETDQALGTRALSVNEGSGKENYTLLLLSTEKGGLPLCEARTANKAI
jgi:hypothetical protein